MIVHREYTNSQATHFTIYDDRVETENPNAVRFRGYLEPLTLMPFPNNPLISKFFVELGLVEEIGSGIKNVHRFLPVYADENLPLFMEDNMFRTVLPLVRYKLSEKTTKALRLLNIAPESLIRAFVERFHELSVPKELFQIVDPDEFFYALVSSWVKEGTKLDRLRMLTVKEEPTFEEWKVPSWEEKGTKLYGKRMVILFKILIGLLAPTSMDELMDFMDYRNRKSFVDSYISPLMENGLITRTHPENPRHPEQKYVTTEKGQRLLGGFEV